ncbi:AAA family ATPase [Kribbella sp. NPDC049584]|uniref:AAA family ATPase n=1 Tax=Kribbella sp. NPDC049584 TaxID=3154833 RepID=UPI00343A3C16
MLYGRDRERAEIDRLLCRARSGRSGVLVLRGDAGIGKTALLDYAAETATDLRVLRGTGIEFEAELPFAFLHLLLNNELHHLEALPTVQANVLQAALGQVTATTDDRFLVGQAVLSLLAEVAGDAPLLCLVDDYQWADRASMDALLFAARRLGAEGVAIILAGADDQAADVADGLPTLRLPGLDRFASVSLVEDRVGELQAPVRDWVVSEAAGNPLALLELPELLSPAQRAGDLPVHGLPAGVEASVSPVQQVFVDRFAALPEYTQAFVLVAAAEDTGELSTVLAAAEKFGATLRDAVPAERSGLVSVDGTTVRFRHPLCRAAVYRSVPTVRQVSVHRALADVLCGPEDADRRAWHLAAGATEYDEFVADELEGAAKRAAERGGRVAVTAAYERAAQLSADRLARGRRLTAAAAAAAEAGLADRAKTLADRASTMVADPHQLAVLAQVRAGLAQAQGSHQLACDILVTGARQIGREVPETAARLLFGAASAACLAVDIAAMEKVTGLLGSLGLSRRADSLVIAEAILGVADVASGRPDSGVPVLREVLARRVDQPDRLGLNEPARIFLSLLTGDIETAHRLAVALEHDCRSRGAIGMLPDALVFLAKTQLVTGHYRDAASNANEGLRIARDTGQRQSIVHLTAILAYIAAVEGAAERCRDLVAAMRWEGPGTADTWSPGVLGLLDLGLGLREAAFDRLKVVTRLPNITIMPSLPLLVEAATALNETAHARAAYEQFAIWALATGERWPTAVMLRCRALLASGNEQEAEAVEEWFAAAVDLHQGTSQSFEHARTCLLYGEWLRRGRRRTDARTQLRAALELFERLNAKPWVIRARTELRASGETESVRTRSADPLRRLTSQEVQVVRLAAQGLSNRAIGARLFLSPRTIGYHLYKAYPKLNVANRAQLTQLLAQNRSND